MLVTERADGGDELAGGDTTANWVAQVCMLKNHATQTMQFCADQAVQILGAMGFMRGTRSERIYREVKVMMIGGGAEEIMKELAARQSACDKHPKQPCPRQHTPTPPPSPSTRVRRWPAQHFRGSGRLQPVCWA
jgi:hypothetical protein